MKTAGDVRALVYICLLGASVGGDLNSWWEWLGFSLGVPTLGWLVSYAWFFTFPPPEAVERTRERGR